MRVQITDHALVRWLERARGIDMEELREVLSDLAQPFVDVRAKHAECDGVWFVFDGEKLVTIVDTKPTTRSLLKNDRRRQNNTHKRNAPMPWQGRKRKRAHK